MDVNFQTETKTLVLQLTEEIDHHTTKKIRRIADYEIERYMPRKVVFDFHHVTFMDSAGIGMILGRYKMITMFGGTMDMVNVTPNVKKVLEMAGITKIIPIIEEIGGTKIGKCV